MGKCTTKIRRLEFIFEDEITHVNVDIEAIGDCPINVQGRHSKSFPPSRSALDILTKEIAEGDYLLW